MDLSPYSQSPEEKKLQQFTRALNALREEVARESGESDLAHLERIKTLSRRMGLLGRGLLHFGVEPVSLSAGVFALWVHKCLEEMEIAHASRSGTDRSDADTQGAPQEFTPWGATARALDWLALSQSLDLHMADSLEFITRHAQEGNELGDYGAATGLHHQLHLRALGYLAKTLVSLPILARPFFWKVGLGNVVAEAARDLFASAMTRAGRVRTSAVRVAATREQWCLAQIESARDIELPRALSILCGALDKRVEHHLFPHLPPNRLRRLAPRVKALCAKYGIRHRSAGLMPAIRLVLSELRSETQLA